ncbi:hypothetical protein [Novosphingobium sediminicola]|uniref:Type II methyltransferase M.Eco57I C-terminal domain-containing protein n=1 Tax=Novosphingobium sediminicola TaxID=563162 RepID=A0A7W6CJF1_9SPHN|nr:hypothetical protein [Novosphingobium sediminicola]MBB3954815.1 hypothetical protein [Novosphingobium sediminicola]
MITGWHWQGRGQGEGDWPASLDELAAGARRVELARAELAGADKWEPLLQGHRGEARAGFVPLAQLAQFRRGIATGANGFFLLNAQKVADLGIDPARCLPCVGRATAVRGLIWRGGGDGLLLNLSDPLTPPEAAYVAQGEADGLPSRYILAHRRPWYAMEQRAVAPIWGAVFARGALRFIHNAAGWSSLTCFHGIYPFSDDPLLHQALVLCLNCDSVRAASRLHGRVYGGGLNKFEPNDLKGLMVPDLRLADRALLEEMAAHLALLDAAPEDEARRRKADELAEEAASRG